MTQVAKIRSHLRAGKTITPATALMVYGIYRLSSVVEDLRNAGLDIDCVIKEDEEGKQYGEYRMRQPITKGSFVQVKRGHGYGLPYWVRRHRQSRVIDKRDDSALVHFIRGAHSAAFWLNDKELVHAN